MEEIALNNGRNQKKKQFELILNLFGTLNIQDLTSIYFKYPFLCSIESLSSKVRYAFQKQSLDV